ncbi:Uncharacterised protein [Serratia fonticola]|uniref:Uncharacterized protein n=1 Tax=Serratia fonticola TaxID=47917 RepID=A0A4U9UVV5_SERFO|nr:Uncharacterised protein [Serratia fonticola]
MSKYRSAVNARDRHIFHSARSLRGVDGSADGGARGVDVVAAQSDRS